MARKPGLQISRDHKGGLFYIFLTDRNRVTIATTVQKLWAANGARIRIDFNDGVVTGIEILL